MRNFDFKRYTPRPKKLLRASLSGHRHQNQAICSEKHALQSMRFTHERSFNEHCILHVRIPFFNWINVFL